MDGGRHGEMAVLSGGKIPMLVLENSGQKKQILTSEGDSERRQL